MYQWVRRNHRLTQSGRRFLEAPWSGGLMLVGGVVLAMLLANLSFTREFYHTILGTELELTVRGGATSLVFPRGMTVETFINDVLMVVFFFLVGLEIKREVAIGELSSTRRALLPVVAAAGGMLAPALIYTFFNHGMISAAGWGIPTATDIAFAIGILSLLGDRVPVSLKIFLTALAVADDLGAILVVAFFYGGHIDLVLLGIALLILVGIWGLNRIGETRMIFYLIPAAAVWTLFYYSGVHSTLSGVVVAMFIPMHPRYNKRTFARRMGHLNEALSTACEDPEAHETFPNEQHRHYLRQMASLSNRSMGMSYRLEHSLAPWVTFVIMPLFALANAGVTIDSVAYLDIFQRTEAAGAVGMGIFFGLLIGKPLGIFTVSFLAVKTRIAEMPAAASWRMLLAVAALGGIGFTMSIFIDTLAFTSPEIIGRGKIAILFGSLASALAGTALILLFTRRKK